MNSDFASGASRLESPFKQIPRELQEALNFVNSALQQPLKAASPQNLQSHLIQSIRQIISQRRSLQP